MIQNKKILAQLIEKERAYRDKDSDVSQSSEKEDGTEAQSLNSKHQESENIDLEPEGNFNVTYSKESASPEIV